jgi:ribosomal protein S18 acetylase RimI-like enzyme
MANSTIALLIRQAVLADAGDIASAHVRSWQAGYAEVVSGEFLHALSKDLPGRTLRWQTTILSAEEESSFVFVGELDGELAGFLGGGPDDLTSGEVYCCYVDPDHWRRGVASALMDSGLERLSQDGYDQAILWVLADNRSARAFYEQRGWHTDGAYNTHEIGGLSYPTVRYCYPLA